MKKRIVTCLLTLLTAMTLVCGCGGSSSVTTAENQQSSAAEKQEEDTKETNTETTASADTGNGGNGNGNVNTDSGELEFDEYGFPLPKKLIRTVNTKDAVNFTKPDFEYETGVLYRMEVKFATGAFLYGENLSIASASKGYWGSIGIPAFINPETGETEKALDHYLNGQTVYVVFNDKYEDALKKDPWKGTSECYTIYAREENGVAYCMTDWLAANGYIVDEMTPSLTEALAAFKAQLDSGEMPLESLEQSTAVKNSPIFNKDAAYVAANRLYFEQNAG